MIRTSSFSYIVLGTVHFVQTWLPQKLENLLTSITIDPKSLSTFKSVNTDFGKLISEIIILKVGVKSRNSIAATYTLHNLGYLAFLVGHGNK